jgi:hypothetical protein
LAFKEPAFKELPCKIPDLRGEIAELDGAIRQLRRSALIAIGFTPGI